MNRHFIYVIRPLRAGFAGGMSADGERLMDKHFDYLKALLAAGTLVMAGPCTDAAFGVVVFKAESEAAARAIMAGDPAVQGGIMQAELHPFRISLHSHE
jgi:uncharacterized protein YciI